MRGWLAGLVAVLGCADGADVARGLAGRADPDEVVVLGGSKDARVGPGREDAAAADARVVPRDAAAGDAAAADATADAAIDAGRDAEVHCRDDDGDGYGIGCAAGPDCLEGDARVHPGALETCDGRDEDCDGQADEGAPACCQPGDRRPCGAFIGTCTEGEQLCDAARGWSACSGVGPREETCDGADEDCDGSVDEGIPSPRDCQAGVGACTAVAPVLCLAGRLRCTAEPSAPRAEVCDGAEDEDCDGAVDEGVRNPCGGCGAAPVERCDGQDEDCDGQVDEGACRGYLLGFDGRWTTPPGLNNGGPLGLGGVVDAAAAFTFAEDEIWAFSGDLLWIYRPAADRWDAPVPARQVGATLLPAETAIGLPVWFRRRFDPAETAGSLTLTRGERYEVLDVQSAPVQGQRTAAGDLWTAWAMDDRAPPRNSPLVASVADIRNADGRWPGSPRAACGADAGALEAVQAVVGEELIWLFDASFCSAFAAVVRRIDWPGFRLAGAPDPARVTAWDHLEREQGGSMEVIFLR
ncbi:MAG: putative metal-binding motif-containing protein [Myxococcales bacterium]|nr:putative metal-binding motif-containing protein [Myxococcales bacterium]